MPTSMDQLMETASQALAHMEYLTCEAHCLEALAVARQQKDWSYYARVLLPLQEVRRQRRMIAADGMIRLGSGDLDSRWCEWPSEYEVGCVVLTHPHTSNLAAQMQQQVRQQNRYVEVLFADRTGQEADIWTVCSFAGLSVTCDIPAPPAGWRDRWLEPLSKTIKDSLTPADWFLHAGELLGDAALAQVDASLAGLERIAALEQGLLAAGDHELLHQQLADAARAMRP